LLGRLPRRDYVVLGSVMADKDADGLLCLLAQAGRSFIATSSTNPRSLPAADLARLAAAYFDSVEPVPEPQRALERARKLAGDGGAVLVTGSLYLLADLSVRFQRIP
jgi:dihydrofolate synthase/folylpolyglutamate synthase